mgnify:CR=1 FL=1
MQENRCPECQVELNWDGQYVCNGCDFHFKKIAFCPDCEAELEKLQACGSASYFCNFKCNELKSKSRAKFIFQKVEA